jgi:N-acetylmuramoyl-L-alanine amidase
MRKIDSIIIHCADTYPNMNIGAKEIRKWHIEENGWSDIGYHYIICRDGRVEIGRGIEIAGAHCRGHNDNSIGICMVGGKGLNDIPDCNFTAIQWKNLRTLVERLRQEYTVEVAGHRDFDAHKTCPNFDVKAWTEGLA